LKSLTILGSTGSIGTSTLDVVRRWPERFQIFALAAGQNVDLVVRQIAEFHPQVVVMADITARDRLAARISGPKPELLYGPEALVRVATAPEVGFVMSAIVGVAGLEATYEAVRRGVQVGLANKEVLVAAGALVMAAARESGTELLPVDSEHNGAHQCLRGGRRSEVTKLILTASGGPFRNTPACDFDNITPAQALQHPTWKMGARITVDSATLMNKGFELIEACWLFDFAPRDVEVVVHPQSTVHAMVEFADGSVLAQVSTTDMRMPIQYAMTYPERANAPVPRMDWTVARDWQFAPPDLDRFPCLRLAGEAFEAGGAATAVLNAADEIAVEAFLKEEISFPGIAQVVEDTLNRVPARTPRTVEEVLAADREARAAARESVAARSRVGLR
jgi:1-deoxy-D-xylulose-5-phosphate reductoisomerase